MSLLVKLIIVLGLIFLIVGQFTKSKAERARRRDRTTHILLVIVIIMLGASIVTNILTH